MSTLDLLMALESAHIHGPWRNNGEVLCVLCPHSAWSPVFDEALTRLKPELLRVLRTPAQDGIVIEKVQGVTK